MIGYDNDYDRFTHDGRLFTERDDDDLMKLAEERTDQHIGRWRDPEHRRYVVYLMEGYDHSGRKVRVVNEMTGEACVYWEGLMGDDGDYTLLANPQVALNYFAAHPVRQPWHDAVPGEVWAVTRESGATVPMYVQRDYAEGDKFAHVNGVEYDVTDERIVEANRLWPVTNEEEK